MTRFPAQNLSVIGPVFRLQRAMVYFGIVDLGGRTLRAAILPYRHLFHQRSKKSMSRIFSKPSQITILGFLYHSTSLAQDSRHAIQRDWLHQIFQYSILPSV